MAILSLYRIETPCGMWWEGGGYTYEERDALEFETEDEALDEIENLGLLYVTAEPFERYSSREAPKIYAATEARNAA